MVERKSRLTLSEPFAASAAFALALLCAGLLFARPRAVPPRELPSLTLPERAVREAMVADAAAAQTAPTSARARALEALLMEHGAAESRGPEDTDVYSKRQRSLATGYRELVDEVGEPVALRLRAKNAQRLEQALDLRLPDAEAKAVLGALPNILKREDAARDGYLVAPRFVVRTLFKARWNILHGLPPTKNFAKVELLAYYGWQTLHAERLPIPQRLRAAQAYQHAGGQDIDEILGVLLYRNGDFALAARAFAAAQHGGLQLRLRNHMLAAQAMAPRQ
jgi:hypothetical protein